MMTRIHLATAGLAMALVSMFQTGTFAAGLANNPVSVERHKEAFGERVCISGEIFAREQFIGIGMRKRLKLERCTLIDQFSSQCCVHKVHAQSASLGQKEVLELVL